MKQAAVCIIGSELVRGIIQDTHAKTISSDLTRLGYQVCKVTLIPDDGGIEDELRSLSNKVDLVITTGGLGPTSDDITRDAVATVYEAPLQLNTEAKQVLAARVGDRLNAANLRQVMIPAGCTVLPNPEGTAPGFALDGRLYALPGPPREMLTMWNGQVMPDLAKRAGLQQSEQQRTEASVFLVPESLLEQTCALAAEHVGETAPLWGTRMQPERISLYLQGSSQETREAFLDYLRRELGQELVQKGDVTACTQLTDRLLATRLTVAGAESCTGGLTGKLLTDLPGSSAYFWGSVTTYADDAKEQILGISPRILAEHGAVSQTCAEAMAAGIRRLSKTDVAFSITGIAGPGGGSAEKPVGTVWFGFDAAERQTQSVCLQFHAYSRESVRRRAAVGACLLLEQYIQGRKLLDIIPQWQYS
ncbi:MAG: nicotinamide-nucleotide amidohydrolase family protein [Spirochaetota bacterium]